MSLKNKLKETFMTIIGAAGINYLTSCADIPENGTVLLKAYDGSVTFHHGPRWEYIGRGNEVGLWNGEKIIQLPLNTLSEGESNFTTRDRKAIEFKVDLIYRHLKNDSSLSKFYVETDNADKNFPIKVDGIVRGVVNSYSQSQIMNMWDSTLVKENKKTVYEAILEALIASDINRTYGIDSTQWEVWPVNTSLLSANVQKDLEKQIQVKINSDRNLAQNIDQEVMRIKADVDKEYVEFTRTLSSSQLKYLKTIQVVRTMGNYKQSGSQKIKVGIIVEDE